MFSVATQIHVFTLWSNSEKSRNVHQKPKIRNARPVWSMIDTQKMDRMKFTHTARYIEFHRIKPQYTRNISFRFNSHFRKITAETIHQETSFFSIDWTYDLHEHFCCAECQFLIDSTLNSKEGCKVIPQDIPINWAETIKSRHFPLKKITLTDMSILSLSIPS